MWLVAAAVPVLLCLVWLAVVSRRGKEAPRSWRPAEIAAFLLAGSVVAVPVCWLERWLAQLVSINPRSHVAGAWGAALASLLLFVPLEEGAKVLTCWRLFRLRAVQSPRRATIYATCLALGFATYENALYLRDAKVAGMLAGLPAAGVFLRELLGTIARLLAAAFWGYTLGRAAARRVVDSVLIGTWVAATVVRALCDHLVFGHGAASLLAAFPLYAGMIAVAYLGREQISPTRRREELGDRLPAVSSSSPPSLAQMRMALRRAERPIMLAWIVIGTLVTMGVNLTCVIAAVLAGRKLGLDFSAIDEGEITGVAPVGLVGLGVLVAFPVAGFLIARASGTSSVLEAALAAGLAIAGTLVMLGLAAPVAIVFALAFAPIAFGLACVGAWVGIEHA